MGSADEGVGREVEAESNVSDGRARLPCLSLTKSLRIASKVPNAKLDAIKCRKYSNTTCRIGDGEPRTAGRSAPFERR